LFGALVGRQVAGVITPSPEILRAPVSGMPCVLYHVVAWELVDARR